MEALLKELQTKLGQAHEEFQARMDKYEEEKKTLGDASAETKAAVEKVNGALDKFEERIKEVETKAAKLDMPPLSLSDNEKKLSLERKAAWDKANRKGPDKLSEEERKLILPDERKVLIESDDTLGGYLTIPEFERDIVKDIVDMSPFRSVARVVNIGKGSYKVRKRTGTFSAVWGEETSNPDETTGLTYGMKEIFARDLLARVDISRSNLDDSEYDMEGELRAEAAEQFAVAEGTAFIEGSGLKEPEGILTNSDISAVNSGDGSTLTADGLIDLWAALKTAYARNAVFLLNRATLAVVRKFKDGEGNYLWQPGLAQAVPNTILGSPYVEMPDMPDVAGSAYPVAYGDFRRGYRIVDRMIMQILRDPYTSGPTVVIFKPYRRVGGQVVQAEAIKKQYISA